MLKRARRLLLRVFDVTAALLSLLLCVAAVIFWYRSWYTVSDIWVFFPSADTHSSWHLETSFGRAEFTRFYQEFPRNMPRRMTWHYMSFPLDRIMMPRNPWGPGDQHKWHLLGFGGSVITPESNPGMWPGSRSTHLVVPLWALTLLFALYPAWYAARWRRAIKRSRQIRAGRCQQCGYDLRASKDRCPECGSPVNALDPSDQPPISRSPSAP
jgi:hypothetical protein